MTITVKEKEENCPLNMELEVLKLIFKMNLIFNFLLLIVLDYTSE